MRPEFDKNLDTLSRQYFERVGKTHGFPQVPFPVRSAEIFALGDLSQHRGNKSCPCRCRRQFGKRIAEVARRLLHLRAMGRDIDIDQLAEHAGGIEFGHELGDCVLVSRNDACARAVDGGDRDTPLARRKRRPPRPAADRPTPSRLGRSFSRISALRRQTIFRASSNEIAPATCAAAASPML